MFQLLALPRKTAVLVRAGYCEDGHAVAHAEGSLVAEQGRGHSQTVQRPGHDLEGAQAAFRCLFAKAGVHCEEFQKIPVRHGLGHAAVKDRALRGVAVGAVVFQLVGQVAAGHEHRFAAQLVHCFGDALAQPVMLQRRKPGQPDAQDGTVHPRLLKEVQREKGAVIQGGILFPQGSSPDAGVFHLVDDLLPQFHVIFRRQPGLSCAEGGHIAGRALAG